MEDHLEASLVYAVSLGKAGLQSKFLFQHKTPNQTKETIFWKSPKEKDREIWFLSEDKVDTAAFVSLAF